VKMEQIGICPKCRKRTLTPFHHSDVVGISACKQHLVRRIHEGNKCPFCDYHECKIETIDHNGRVLSRS
jgi:hypothetical protein